jgi:hypothetical protein
MDSREGIEIRRRNNAFNSVVFQIALDHFGLNGIHGHMDFDQNLLFSFLGPTGARPP